MIFFKKGSLCISLKNFNCLTRKCLSMGREKGLCISCRKEWETPRLLFLATFSPHQSALWKAGQELKRKSNF